MKQVLCTTLLLLAFTLHALAQAGNKFDVILKTNGDEMKGKVTEILDDAVKFTYAGETTLYTVKKAEILKITFASGRVERFSDPNAATATPAPVATTNPPNTAAAALPTSTPEERHNKVAVLPFAFTRDGQPADEQVSMDVQDQVFDLLGKHAGVRTILPPRRTNVLLNKAGITRASLMNYTMDELCSILGVEFIVTGSISVNRTSQTSYSSGSGTENKKNDDKKTYSSNAYGTTEQHYASNTELHIYNDTGATVYNQHRSSMLSYQDSYKSTVEYLLKRCPLYSK